MTIDRLECRSEKGKQHLGEDRDGTTDFWGGAEKYLFNPLMDDFDQEQHHG
jgi:hypothetical protein